MKVLLTGASGFLGGSLAKLLKKNGFELIATLRSNPSDSLTKLADKIIDVLNNDVKTQNSIENLISKYDENKIEFFGEIGKIKLDMPFLLSL